MLLSLVPAWPAGRPKTSHPYIRLLGLVVLTGILMTLLVACSAFSRPGDDIKGPKVIARDNVFEPKEIHVKTGETITWINEGQTIHTVTADDKSFDSGDFDAGKTYSRAFTKPGRYPYFCILHGSAGGKGMVGVVVVEGATSTFPGSSADYANSQNMQRAQAGYVPHAILRVPEEFSTVTAAVKAAKAHDLISIGPGTYQEAVVVNTSDITIRGRDRNAVIMDGNFALPNAFQVTANNVIIENMTARHYKGNGFYWTGVHGYRGSYLTAYNNGDYGVYAFNSVQGQFDHSLASGHPDSGFYIGGCQPCHALITDVISENNALGYSGTNAGGDLVIRDSIWRNNISGIVPNTLDSEPNAPQEGATIIGNLVENNNNFEVPSGPSEYPSGGNGIVLAGGNNNVVENNRVNGHQYYGIVVIANIDKNFWMPGKNTVKNNNVTNSGVADLALASLSSGGNCFSDNTAIRTVPPFLQQTHACGSSLTGVAGAGDPSVMFSLLNRFIRVLTNRYTHGDWRTYPLPADLNQPGMPDPNADPQGIMNSVEGTKLNMTPAATSIAPGLTLAGLGLNNPFFTVLFTFYSYFLPLALYAAWVGIGIWDIVRRSDMKGEGDMKFRSGMTEGAKLGWIAIILLVPVLGPLAYFLFGRSEISRTTRLALVIGAPVVYLLLTVVLMLLVS